MLCKLCCLCPTWSGCLVYKPGLWFCSRVMWLQKQDRDLISFEVIRADHERVRHIESSETISSSMSHH